MSGSYEQPPLEPWGCACTPRFRRSMVARGDEVYERVVMGHAASCPTPDSEPEREFRPRSVVPVDEVLDVATAEALYGPSSGPRTRLAVGEG